MKRRLSLPSRGGIIVFYATEGIKSKLHEDRVIPPIVREIATPTPGRTPASTPPPTPPPPPTPIPVPQPSWEKFLASGTELRGMLRTTAGGSEVGLGKVTLKILSFEEKGRWITGTFTDWKGTKAKFRR